MRIIIDLQGAQTNGSRNRGIGRYSSSLAQAILRNNERHDIHIVLNGAFPDSIDEIRTKFADFISQDRIHVWKQLPSVAFAVPGSKARRRASQVIRERFIQELNPDVVFVTSLFEGLSDDGLISIGLCGNVPTVVTLYDLIPLINKGDYLHDRQISQWYMDRVDQLRRADRLLSISESARREAIDHLGFDKTTAISVGTAADPHFKSTTISPDCEESLRQKYDLRKPFVMYTGGIDVRKNIERLIGAFAKLPRSVRNKYQLAIVCSAHQHDRNRLLQLASEKGLSDGDIVFTGYVSEDELVTLYHLTRLFIFPSWHEGFGLPALEAMHCGAPVIASNRSSLPEVVELEEAMFDPFDQEEITSRMHAGLEDDPYRIMLLENSRVQSAKFDWDSCAIRALGAIEELGRAPHPAASYRSDARPRLAFVSPLPPARTGIADYSAELLASLTKNFQIDVVLANGVNSDLIEFPLIPEAIGVMSEAEFRQNYGDFDNIIYHFGNSEFHSYMFELLQLTGGVVVLHDFFLSGIVSYREWHHLEPHGWQRELYRSHGYPALLARKSAVDVYDTVWKYPCSKTVVDLAEKVVVHSEFGRHLARQWYGRQADSKFQFIPLLREPYTDKSDKASLKKELGFAADDLIVCSFGMIGSTKLNRELAQAWVKSRLGGDRRCKLVFVGQNDQGVYGAELSDFITKKGKKRIFIAGWTDAETFRRYLSVADMAVQLRTWSRGETSAAVLDCMNHGVPLIVNDNGGMASLADQGALVLRDQFEISELTEALEELAGSSEMRAKLGGLGRERVLTGHSPAECAEAYSRVLAAARLDRNRLDYAIDLVRQAGLSTFEKSQFSSAFANASPHENKRLLIDISVLARTDAGTGIQRVVRNVLKDMLGRDFLDFRIEPVFVDPAVRKFRFARSFTTGFLKVEPVDLPDDVVDIGQSDTVLLLDLNPMLLTFVKEELLRLRRQGTKIVSVVYDLIPIKHPDLFPDGVAQAHREWLEIVAAGDTATCISKGVADDLRDYLDTAHPNTHLPISHFKLGADLDDVRSSVAASVGSISAADRNAEPTFIMVGTIEPRKGHLEVLRAFEALWDSGKKIRLIIVGNPGWKAEKIVRRLEELAPDHPLEWRQNISDEQLERLYGEADCLIAASLDEGFGLPLIEAASRNVRLIARDIPVFREVCGDCASYFTDDLIATLEEWLQSFQAGTAISSEGITRVSWEESVDTLLPTIFPDEDFKVRI
ncbi:glycosyltransferase [Sphingomonas ginkgonis]|uniref:Glycosyltransferase n=1 Tax=Sphingomonas ginkgonis TaxID=2315330 RepID=A0A3R9YLB7_9SPHN|nr:glycosyltransferase [Sphingomonas ginkgonis]RST30380.1 glycosyltransferase [Sphingomonas ginkgonis]